MLKFNVEDRGDWSVGIPGSFFTVTFDHDILEPFKDDPEEYEEQLTYLEDALKETFSTFMDSRVTVMEENRRKRMLEAERKHDEWLANMEKEFHNR